MDRLDAGYSRGFTKGLFEARNIINYISYDMRLHRRRMTDKELLKVFDCAIKHRECLREDPDCFIRCKKDGGYEVFNSRRQEIVE